MTAYMHCNNANYFINNYLQSTEISELIGTRSMNHLILQFFKLFLLMVHHIIWAKTHIVASHYWVQSPHDDANTFWAMAQKATPSLTQLGSFLLTHLSTFFLICTSLNISQVTSSHNAPSMQISFFFFSLCFLINDYF